MDHDKKTVLITGASSGIGYEFCKIFAAHGFDLVITARSEEKLNEFAHILEADYKIKVKSIAADLSVSNSAKKIFEETEKTGIKINLLVNNAGIGMRGEFTDMSLAKQLYMIDLNVKALTELTYLFANEMVKSGGGKILNVASTASFQPGPLMAVYYASKAYVLHFSEAIANELKDKNVSVTVLCPGPTKTGFEKAAGMKDTKLFKSNFIMTPKKVALLGYNGMMKNKTLVITGIINKVLMLAARFVPRKMTTSVTRKLQEV